MKKKCFPQIKLLVVITVIAILSGIPMSARANDTVESYRNAAEQGDAEAQFRLGACYQGGVGVTKDLTEAVEWFRMAAEQGNKDAQEALLILKK